MPDHLHLIAHQGYEAVRLGQWIKALKAVVGGLEARQERPVPPPGVPVGRMPSPGVPTADHQFTRLKRPWRWQSGFHDHKFRTPESEARKWEYICLNPVRLRLVDRPEQWPFGGEVFYDEPGGPRLVRGTPPLLETGLLIQEDGTLRGGRSDSPGEKGTNAPGEGTRPYNMNPCRETSSPVCPVGPVGRVPSPGAVVLVGGRVPPRGASPLPPNAASGARPTRRILPL